MSAISYIEARQILECAGSRTREPTSTCPRNQFTKRFHSTYIINVRFKHVKSADAKSRQTKIASESHQGWQKEKKSVLIIIIYAFCLENFQQIIYQLRKNIKSK